MKDENQNWSGIVFLVLVLLLIVICGVAAVSEARENSAERKAILEATTGLYPNQEQILELTGDYSLKILLDQGKIVLAVTTNFEQSLANINLEQTSTRGTINSVWNEPIVEVLQDGTTVVKVQFYGSTPASLLVNNRPFYITTCTITLNDSPSISC